MGDGLDRAGYKQVARCVDAILIGPSAGSTAYTCGTWAMIEVVSSVAIFAGITAPGLTNAANITSGTTFLQGAIIACSKITQIKLSSDATDNMVIAFNRILL